MTERVAHRDTTKVVYVTDHLDGTQTVRAEWQQNDNDPTRRERVIDGDLDTRVTVLTHAGTGGAVEARYVERDFEHDPGRVWGALQWGAGQAVWCDNVAAYGADQWTDLPSDAIPGNQGICLSLGGRVFAADEDAGFYRAGYRADAAYTAGDWTQVRPVPMGGVTGVKATSLLDGWDDGTLLVGFYGDPQGGPEILRSDDWGDTWTQVWADPTLRHMHVLRRDPYHPDMVYAVPGDVRKPLLFSDDRGATWQDVGAFPTVGMDFTPNYVIGGGDGTGNGALRALRKRTWQPYTLTPTHPRDLWAAGDTTWFVRYDPDHDVTYGLTVGGDSGSGKYLTLWMVSEWGTAPVFLAARPPEVTSSQGLWLSEHAVLFRDRKIARRKMEVLAPRR